MSALWAPLTGGRDETKATRRSLHPVAEPAPRLARFPFLLVLIGIFGLGMAGLLMLNTTLQSQAFESRTLNRQAGELAYAQADLENQLDEVSGGRHLRRRPLVANDQIVDANELPPHASRGDPDITIDVFDDRSCHA